MNGNTKRKKGTVYIVNRAGHDFSPAEKWGKLVPVTVGNINVFRPDRDMFQISETLKEFNYEKDYLLLSGNVFANALAVASILYSCQAPSIDLLVYDAKNQDYLSHTITYSKKDREMRLLRPKPEEEEEPAA